MADRFNFRAWDLQTEEMKPWWVIRRAGYNQKHARVKDPDGHGKFVDCFCDQDYIIMQSTGLIDENGVEVFEGDILSTKGRNYEVMWCATDFNTGWVKKKGDSLTDIGQTLTDTLIVIGNIYENPELKEKR